MSLCALLSAKEEDWRRIVPFPRRWRRVRRLLVHANHCPLVVLIGLPVCRAEEWEAGVGADDTALLGGGASGGGGAGGFENGSAQVFVGLLLRRWCTCSDVSLSARMFGSWAVGRKGELERQIVRTKHDASVPTV